MIMVFFEQGFSMFWLMLVYFCRRTQCNATVENFNLKHILTKPIYL